MQKINSIVLEDIVKRLRKGEKVECPLCQNGYLEPVGDYRTTYAFRCNGCGERLLMEPMTRKKQ